MSDRAVLMTLMSSISIAVARQATTIVTVRLAGRLIQSSVATPGRSRAVSTEARASAVRGVAVPTEVVLLVRLLPQPGGLEGLGVAEPRATPDEESPSR